MESRFGKVKRQHIPYTHVGIVHEKLSTGAGYKLHQAPFVSQIRPIKIERGDLDTRSLTASELTSLRSVLGALLYATITRADVCAGICLAASKICEATVKQLRDINSVLAIAHANPEHGLIFRSLAPPLMVLSISDSSYSTSSTSYAVEGHLVLLMSCADACFKEGTREGHFLDGPCHLLSHGSHKASRISHSTSHAEALAHWTASQHA